MKSNILELRSRMVEISWVQKRSLMSTLGELRRLKPMMWSKET